MGTQRVLWHKPPPPRHSTAQGNPAPNKHVLPNLTNVCSEPHPFAIAPSIAPTKNNRANIHNGTNQKMEPNKKH